MTIEELNKLRIAAPIHIEQHTEWDQYGQYSTGCFKYKDKIILITIDDGKWHMSISANHPLGATSSIPGCRLNSRQKESGSNL